MNDKRYKAGALILAIASIGATAFPITQAAAADYSCVVEASDDMHLRVWNEDNHGANGSQLLDARLHRGDRRRIVSADGRIRYDFMRAGEDGFGHRNTGAWCKRGTRVSIL